jgi:hypothetical protein
MLAPVCFHTSISTPPPPFRCPQVIAEEEASFSRTLVKGLERFKKFAAASTDGKISGAEVGAGASLS